MEELRRAEASKKEAAKKDINVDQIQMGIVT